MGRLDTIRLFTKAVKDRDNQWNFDQIKKSLAELCPVCKGVEVGPIDLIAGVNLVPTGLLMPRARIVTYQSAVATLTDQGFTNGRWSITASAPCTCRFIFY